MSPVGGDRPRERGPHRWLARGDPISRLLAELYDPANPPNVELGARSANALRSADDPTRGRGARLRDDAEPFTPEGRVIDQGSSQRGTPSTGRLVEETELVGQSSVLPEITGRIWNTSVGQYLLDAEDPFLGRFAL